MINSTAYYNDFWNEMRGKQAVTDSLYNNRESKTNAYHLPGESNKKYTAALQKESVVRQLATVVNATRSDSRLWTFDCEGQAEWGDMVNLEGMDNEDDFQRFEVQAYRNWCNDNGYFAENSRNFNQALRTIGTVVRKRPRDGGEKNTLLTGYRLLCRDFFC